MAKLKTKEIRNIITDTLVSVENISKEELIDTLRYIKAKTGDAEWQLRPQVTCKVEVEGCTFHFENITDRNKIEVKDDKLSLRKNMYGGYKNHSLLGTVCLTVTREGEVGDVLFFKAGKRGDWYSSRYADMKWEVKNRKEVLDFFDQNLISEEGDLGMYWWD